MVRKSKNVVTFTEDEKGQRELSVFLKVWERTALHQGTGRLDVAKAMAKDSVIGRKIIDGIPDTAKEDERDEAMKANLAKLVAVVKGLRDKAEKIVAENSKDSAQAAQMVDALTLRTLTGRGRPTEDKRGLILGTAILLGLEKTANQ